MPFSFDALDPAVRASIGENITAISAQTQAAVQTVITRGFREQIPPAKLARMIKRVVGLDERSAQAVMTYEATLLNGGMQPAAANALVGKYALRKIAERGRAIARTETMSLLNEGQRSALRQAVSIGYLPESSLKTYILTDDEKLCPVCSELEGESVPVNDEFPGGDPPLHPNCRCTFGFEAGE